LLGSTENFTDPATLAADSRTPSLCIVEPNDVHWRIEKWERRRIRVEFDLAGVSYRLSLTDPVWAQRLADLPVGHHARTTAGIPPAARTFLTVSFGEPYEKDGLCYKLVAAVIVVP
jgi:hypothetical protein